MSVWISAQSVINYVLTQWEHITVLVKKATELKVMGKLASISPCQEFYCICSKLLSPPFCPSGAMETTYFLTQPVLPFLSS